MRVENQIGRMESETTESKRVKRTCEEAEVPGWGVLGAQGGNPGLAKPTRSDRLLKVQGIGRCRSCFTKLAIAIRTGHRIRLRGHTASQVHTLMVSDAGLTTHHCRGKDQSQLQKKEEQETLHRIPSKLDQCIHSESLPNSESLGLVCFSLLWNSAQAF